MPAGWQHHHLLVVQAFTPSPHLLDYATTKGAS